MKIKISEKKFNQILQEEVKRYKDIKSLESDKKQIQEAISKLQNAKSQEEIDEIWGGVKKLFQKGGQAFAQGAKDVYQGAKADVQQFGGDIKQGVQQVGGALKQGAQAVQKGAQQVGQSVQQGAQQIKQTYQQGEKEQSIKNTKRQIEKLWAKKREVQQQLADLQMQYQGLTGKKLGTQFTPKQKPAPVAKPVQQVAESKKR